MKRVLKYISFALVVVIAVSCEKNVVEYQSTSISDEAEYQIHYVVPVTAVAANNIYKVEVNNQLIANATAPLSTYNAIPSGAVGRFYTTTPGTVNLKLYTSTAQTLAYDKNVTLTKGKQNVFVYDFNSDPIVFDNGFPYQANLTEKSDSTCFVKFYNFLYEKANTPCTLKLQYQYVDPRTKAAVNIGKPVAFGETTGWQPVKIVKEVVISESYAKVYFNIKVVDANGVITGDLQQWDTNKKYVSYTGFATEYVGRRYHHIISGMRSDLPVASVRSFTAL